MENSGHDIIPRGYSHDTGMTFILERVPSISIMCFSAFLYMILKWHFAPIQVILVFILDETNLWGMKFKLKTNFVLD